MVLPKKGLKVGDRVFWAEGNMFATIVEVFDNVQAVGLVLDRKYRNHYNIATVTYAEVMPAPPERIRRVFSEGRNLQCN